MGVAYGRQEICVLFLVGMPDRMNPFGKFWHRREDNSKLDLQVVQWGRVDWMNLVQGREKWLALVNVVMKRQVSPIEGVLLAENLSASEEGLRSKVLVPGQ